MSGEIRRALISVSNKTGLVDLGKYLADHGVELLSTGGSAAMLKEAGVAVREVADHTGFPEIMDGRVKTLHPKIHGGLLGRRDQVDDQKTMAELNIEPIDLVVVNLYPFEQTVASGASFEDSIENIDIGGPAMIRSAAKNHIAVTVIVDPQDYSQLVEEMAAHKGLTTLNFRQKLAGKAYRHTAAYDATIGSWFADQLDVVFPERFVFSGQLQKSLRYGENPHQSAAFYVSGGNGFGLATATQLQGKELSFNNLNDTDAAFTLVAEFEQPACAIIKHANPCGVALADELQTAYGRALVCDQESAFGGVVAFNQTLDSATAEEVVKLFAEVVIAPEIKDSARKILEKKENLRVLRTGGIPDITADGYDVRTLVGGLLIQGVDNTVVDGELKVVTKRAPTDKEMADLCFAFTVAKHVKSNAIVYAKDGATVGIGAGQMSRVNSSRIAAWKAADAAQATGQDISLAEGSVVASDAFFPFADGLLAAAEAGVTAVIQPGGSIRDEEVITAADDNDLAMVFTGMRHFRH